MTKTERHNWNGLSDDAKRAHNIAVSHAATALRAAESTLAEAMRHLTPAFPGNWREGSALWAARVAQEKYERALEEHDSLVRRYSR